tara:strand:- start:795 stop:2045 length:1251 start_codon:yes stop_codon:yes gene_type:complete
MYNLIKELYPIQRAITGNGVRETHKKIKEIIPINTHEIKSGTKVFDWIVPKEWNIKNAYVKDSKGNKVIDYKLHNLHIVVYSIPFKGKVTLDELKKHITTLPEFPDWIPYKTSYYNKDWGFCMKHNDFLKLKDEIYEIFIDSELKDGSLTYSDLIIKGKTDKEILLSTYTCHPSMCNDNLSGPALLTYLAKYLLEKQNNYYTYRIVFIPEAIGSVVYVNQNYDNLKKNVIGGYVIGFVGDNGNFTYLQSRQENQLTDKVTMFCLDNNTKSYRLRDHTVCGMDERNYNFPTVDLNVGALMRTKFFEFDEYHTSADNLNFICENALNESLEMYKKCIDIFENNKIYQVNSICEPRLGIHGLWDIGATKYKKKDIFRFIIYYCDGKHDLIDICKKIKRNYEDVKNAINILYEKNIINLK